MGPVMQWQVTLAPFTPSRPCPAAWHDQAYFRLTSTHTSTSTHTHTLLDRRKRLNMDPAAAELEDAPFSTNFTRHPDNFLIFQLINCFASRAPAVSR